MLAEQENRSSSALVRFLDAFLQDRNIKWILGVGVILSTLSVQDVLALTHQAAVQAQDPTAVLLAYVHFYDQRGGAVEVEIKEDKQGLGTTRRNKKRFEAQQMVIQLEALAHNTLVWARQWLTPHWPNIARFGMLRLVRDVFHMNGLILLDHKAQVFQIILNQADPHPHELWQALQHYRPNSNLPLLWAKLKRPQSIRVPQNWLGL